jgi:tetratricopeptide (TPR) repeat protein
VSPQEAEKLYRQATAVQPDYAIAHLNLGFLLRSEGRNTEGNAELLKATQLDPKLASRIPAGLNLNPPPPAPSPSPTR